MFDGLTWIWCALADVVAGLEWTLVRPGSSSGSVLDVLISLVFAFRVGGISQIL